VLSPEMAEAIVEGGRRGRVTLTALYDDRCPLCRRLKEWLAGQATLAAVEFVPADSAESHDRFPLLDHARTTRVLTVVSSEGAVYEGERAWLVCGWSLPAWQPVTEQLGRGLRLRLVGVVARAVDGYRHRRLPGAERCERCGVG
jgi:predicted DCC family thiol-disulfide oxidoreductase YuxK